MVFSEIPFLFQFLPLFLILYYIVPFGFKNTLLLLFSLLFYSWGEPSYIILMVLCVAANYLFALLIERSAKHKKLYLALSVIVNLIPMVVFKYSNLLISTANAALGTGIPLLPLALPIGISFYTFQTMSYVIDVYRGDVPVQKNYFALLTYICMFPQLIAGPIVRYETIANELSERKINLSGFCDGMIRFLHGIFKKVILANSVAVAFYEISASDISSQSALTLWLGIIAYYFLIYFDFSGYSDMAIGMGKMLGFNFLENFNYPMTAISVTDFWRRWHMSLTTWFKDYVYIPLGGSRCPTPRKILNILIVWLLTGIWHGASWNFLFWGLYFGVILLLEKMVFAKILAKTPKFIRFIVTAILVTIGWAIFSLEDFGLMFAYIAGMFNIGNIADTTFLYYLVPYLPLFFICGICATPIYHRIRAFADSRRSKAAEGVCYCIGIVFYIAMFVLSWALIASDSYSPFLYFKF